MSETKQPLRTVNGIARELLIGMIRQSFNTIVDWEGTEPMPGVNDIQLFLERNLGHVGRRGQSSGACAAASVLWLFGFRVKK